MTNNFKSDKQRKLVMAKLSGNAPNNRTGKGSLNIANSSKKRKQQDTKISSKKASFITRLTTELRAVKKERQEATAMRLKKRAERQEEETKRIQAINIQSERIRTAKQKENKARQQLKKAREEAFKQSTAGKIFSAAKKLTK